MSKYPNSGIYQITVSPNGKRYIGSAINLTDRWKVHICLLKKGTHHNNHLQHCVLKYGIDSVRFSVVESCGKDALVSREQFYIDTMAPELNFCKIAGSCVGVKHSEETRRKMKLAQIEASKTRRVWNKGMKMPESTRAKVKLARARQIMPKGHKFTDEHKANLSKAKKGKPAWSKGRKMPSITKAKLEYWKSFRNQRESKPITNTWHLIKITAAPSAKTGASAMA